MSIQGCLKLEKNNKWQPLTMFWFLDAK